MFFFAILELNVLLIAVITCRERVANLLICAARDCIRTETPYTVAGIIGTAVWNDAKDAAKSKPEEEANRALTDVYKDAFEANMEDALFQLECILNKHKKVGWRKNVMSAAINLIRKKMKPLATK